MPNLNIGVFTGNRAEFGLLRPLFRAISRAPDMSLSLFVGGALLNEKYGQNLQEISQENITIAARIEIPEPGANGVSTSSAIGIAIQKCEEAFLDQNLDGLFVYADRYEGFAAVIAASHSNLPVLHIEGGDITEGGAYDDNVRHAMTKLSHLHFTSNELASDILKEMGEEAWRIQNVGLLPFAEKKTSDYLTPRDLWEAMELELNRNIVLFTLHSISSSVEQTKMEAEASFQALKKICSKPETSVVITYPNDDNGSDVILKEIDRIRSSSPNFHVFPSLGQRRYYGILNLSRHGFDVVCMGNSSSIVKECVFFGVTGILIGSRQNGRLIPNNVSKCSAELDAILTCYDGRTKDNSSLDNPYYVENGVELALEHLRLHIKNPRILRKKYER